MAEMRSHLEYMIKGELSATRMDIQNVLQWIEESEEHVDERKKTLWNCEKGLSWIGLQ